MSDSDSSKNPSSTNAIVRDALIFQVKLWLEGFKDLVLMPLSLGAALIDILFRDPSNRGALYAVMKMGNRFERWVHLYAALEDTEAHEPKDFRGDSLDDLLNEAADGIEENMSDGSPEATDATQSKL